MTLLSPFKSAAVRILDRPGLRGLLAWVGTKFANQVGGFPTEIRFDEVWYHRGGDFLFPDGWHFSYHRAAFARWKHQGAKCLSDAEEYWFQHYHPEPGDVIVDIGAGRGEDVLAFSRRVGPQGRVIAVEAHPFSYGLLRHFCRLNGLANVDAVNAAAMDGPGTIAMSESIHWVAHSVVANGRESRLEVPALTIDQICADRGIGKVSFLKMNIEGAERQALAGAEETLARTDVVCIACHDFRADKGDGDEFRTRAFVESFLSQRGFQLSRRADHPLDYVRDHLFGVRHKT